MKRTVTAITAAVAIMSALSADAAYKFEGFNGGNAPGFVKLGNYTWSEKGFPCDYKIWRASGLSWGGIGMSAKVSQQGSRCEGAGYWMNSGGWAAPTYEVRAKYTSYSIYTWGGAWTYNDRQTYNNYMEIDLFENVEKGTYNNYYWRWNNGVVGSSKLHQVYGSWRTDWAKYKAFVSTAVKGRIHFYRNGTWKAAHTGLNRTAETARPKFNNRCWPISVERDNANVQELPALQVDWYQVWY